MKMKIAIIGGKLRGTEIALLAGIAGIHTVLIDKDKLTPASGLCEETYVFDVEKKEPALLSILKNVDIVIPAVERSSVLTAIEEMCREIDLKVAFDFMAYDVTSSRIQADLLVKEADFPHLTYYPDAEPPYVLKPAIGNRRRSIKLVDTDEELNFLMSRKNSPESWIAQEYEAGPVYNVEVIGSPGNYSTYEITQIHLENDFDNGMLSCPVDLDEDTKQLFKDRAVFLAEKIQLRGIMSVEAVDTGDALKIMEMNAIFPTQSPVAMFYSTGINILIELLRIFADEDMEKRLSAHIDMKYDNPKYVVLKNFQFFNHTPTFNGESNLRKAGPLKVMVDLFGSDYAITDYIDDDHEWQAVFINISDTKDGLVKKRISARETLLTHCRTWL